MAQTQQTEIIFLVEEEPEGGYVARAIGESIFTQGETLAELREMVRDAVQCHFEENGINYPLFQRANLKGQV
jgi:predicted RNase H-like HicB family nuclease